MSVTRGELTKLEHLALDQGWTVETGTGHSARWTNPTGKTITTAREPDGPANYTLNRRHLEEAGLRIPGRKPRDQGRAVPAPETREEPAVTAKPLRPDYQAGLLDPLAHQERALVADVIDRAGQAAADRRLVLDALGDFDRDRLATVEDSILALEGMVNEVADQLKFFRDSYQESLPVLRQDVQLLKARPEVSVDELVNAAQAVLATELLKARAEIDKQLDELATQNLGFISDLETRLLAKIQNAQAAATAAVDPLTALRQRLGGPR